mgnify:CR=1 FL=1
MDNNLFDDLVTSIKEAGAIKRNEIKASRVTELELPDIKEVREKTRTLCSVSDAPVIVSSGCVGTTKIDKGTGGRRNGRTHHRCYGHDKRCNRRNDYRY